MQERVIVGGSDHSDLGPDREAMALGREANIGEGPVLGPSNRIPRPKEGHHVPTLSGSARTLTSTSPFVWPKSIAMAPMWWILSSGSTRRAQRAHRSTTSLAKAASFDTGRSTTAGSALRLEPPEVLIAAKR